MTKAEDRLERATLNRVVETSYPSPERQVETERARDALTAAAVLANREEQGQ